MLRNMRLSAAAKILQEGIGETVTYYQFPREHHRSIRTNNMLERIMKEIRRRTRVVGSFPDGKSALMLACADSSTSLQKPGPILLRKI